MTKERSQQPKRKKRGTTKSDLTGKQELPATSCPGEETSPGPGRDIARATEMRTVRRVVADDKGRRIVQVEAEVDLDGPKYLENPLIHMSEERRSRLFVFMRECPYDDAVRQMLADDGLPGITREQMDDFFLFESEQHWEKRISRAAVEADALVRLVEKSPVKFSAGILAALGQETFRQIASGQVEAEAMGKIATLFLRARVDERADLLQRLKREQVRQGLQGQVELALEKLAEEVERNPKAREAFEALREELSGVTNVTGESL